MTQGRDDERKSNRHPLPHAFKPGNPGGPGRTKGIPLYKPRMNPEVLKEMIDKYFLLDIDQLEECKKNNKLTAIEHVIISTMFSAKKYGDMGKLDILLNRLIGKMTDKVEIKTPTPYIIEKRDGQQLEMGGEIEE